MVTVIIVAAGKGERLAAGADKPFVKLNGRSIISYSLSLFEKIAEITSIILVVSKEKTVETAGLVKYYGSRKVKKIVTGGAIRQESVSNGLKTLPPGTQTVLVHDAARPLVSKDMVLRLIAAGQMKATIPVLPVSDTLKEVKNGRVLRTVDRRHLYTVQTPQAFPREIILAAYRQAQCSGTVGTDDAALVEAAGFPIQTVEGEHSNIKITYPEDLLYAELLLKNKKHALPD